MLNHLALKNFKAWKKLDITFGKVTGLFGTNSSGKSSLLQFLLLLKQTKNATDRGLVLDFGGPEKYVNLGTFQDMVHGHNTERQVNFTLQWSLSSTLEVNNPEGKRTDILFSSDEMGISSAISQNNKQLHADFLKYHFSDQQFSLSPKGDSRTEYKLTPDTKSSSGKFHFMRTKGRAWALPGPIKNYLFPDQAKTYYKNANLLSEFEYEYESLMDKIYYLGPLREHPRREYQWAGAKPADVGIRGERTIDAILSATSRTEDRNLGGKTHYKPFESIIAHWLKELSLIHSFRVEEISEGSNLFRAKVKRDPRSTEVLLTDVGFGVSQVLPALVLLYYVPEGSIILMEQPEIHLHPSVQSGLADIILHVSKQRKLQVIVESHSEHLLKRLQRRVAEDKFSTDFIKLYFCNSYGGQSELHNLKMNLFGEIENWPTNFFGDEFSEIAAIQDAIIKKKIKASTND